MHILNQRILTAKKTGSGIFTSSYSTVSGQLKSDFEILGIPHNSNKKQVKSAYFQKAKLLHPDNKQRSVEWWNEKS